MIDVKNLPDNIRIKIRHFVLQEYDWIRDSLKIHESMRFEHKDGFGFTLTGEEELIKLLKDIK